MLKYLLTFAGFLLVIYGSLFYLSVKGWGYGGYAKVYHRPSSYWYFGGSNYYPHQYHRTGSVGGSSTVGGGSQGGK